MSWVGVSGFGSFVGFPRNPSGEVARALAAAGAWPVRAVVLPVSLEDSPRAFEAWLDGQDSAPGALLALGVHSGPEYRLERRAGTRMHSAKVDNDGVVGEGRTFADEELEASADLARLAEALAAEGAETVRVSEDAGGFVCERTYHAVLSRARPLGLPAVFLHVPALAHVALERQARAVGGLVGELARQAGLTPRDTPLGPGRDGPLS